MKLNLDALPTVKHIYKTEQEYVFGKTSFPVPCQVSMCYTKLTQITA